LLEILRKKPNQERIQLMNSIFQYFEALPEYY